MQTRPPFALVAGLEWDKAQAFANERNDYGEQRMIAIAPLRGRLHVVCYVIRGYFRRIISFRKANRREVRAYEQATANQ